MYKATIKRWDGREHILLETALEDIKEIVQLVVCKLEEEEHEVKSVRLRRLNEMKFNDKFATNCGDDSRWDEKMSCELVVEIERIDQANRRKRKALRELTRAVEKRNKHIKELEAMISVIGIELDKLIDYCEE